MLLCPFSFFVSETSQGRPGRAGLGLFRAVFLQPPFSVFRFVYAGAGRNISPYTRNSESRATACGSSGPPAWDGGPGNGVRPARPLPQQRGPVHTVSILKVPDEKLA